MSYEYISTLRASEKGDIRLVRDENGTLLIQRYRDIDRQLLKKLMETESPYIAGTLGFGEDENGFFTIEQYIDGTPANEVRFTEKQAVRALLELCEALKALHRVGIVHRDIKPSNIIIGNDEHARLIDFDAARIMKEYQSHDTGCLGTIGYAPPEQYGFMQTDARSDIYALGMTMAELLASAAAKPKFRRIIAKCTAFDPEKRYSDISLVERALKRRFPFAAVTALFAAVLVTAGTLLMAEENKPQEHTMTSEIVDIPTSDITAEPVPSHEETAEQADTMTASESAETEEYIPHETQSAIPAPQTEEQPVIEDVTEAPSQNRMTFETLQDENGRNYDSYEYVFYDDPALHGSWVLCATSRAIPEGDIFFPGTLEKYQPKYITVFPDGTLKTYNAGLRELNSFRWTDGWCIDDSTDIHKVEQLLVLTNSDGTQHLIYERKPMYNGDDAMPHIYFIYRRVG